MARNPITERWWGNPSLDDDNKIYHAMMTRQHIAQWQMRKIHHNMIERKFVAGWWWETHHENNDIIWIESIVRCRKERKIDHTLNLRYQKEQEKRKRKTKGLENHHSSVSWTSSRKDESSRSWCKNDPWTEISPTPEEDEYGAHSDPKNAQN